MNEPWKPWPEQPARGISPVVDPGAAYVPDGMSRPLVTDAEALPWDGRPRWNAIPRPHTCPSAYIPKSVA
jgi:hypothetical protein